MFQPDVAVLVSARVLSWPDHDRGERVGEHGRAFDQFDGTTPEYRAESLASAEALEVLRGTDPSVDWTYLSPAPVIDEGERTGSYRVGTDKVRGWIARRELIALNTADVRRCGKPRWVITPHALAKFQTRHKAEGPPKPVPRHRRPPQVKEYYP